jgi:hypothetical protein
MTQFYLVSVILRILFLGSGSLAEFGFGTRSSGIVSGIAYHNSFG